MRICFVYTCTKLLAFPNYRLEKVCSTREVAEQWIEKHKNEPEHQFKMEGYKEDPDNYYFEIKEVETIEQVE